MYIVSYSKRKLTLEMTFRAKTDVKNAAKKMTFRPLDTHVPLSAFNYVHLALMSSSNIVFRAYILLFYRQLESWKIDVKETIIIVLES